jgi:hypothetical protein
MNPIQNTEVNQNESNNDSALAVDIQGIDHWGIPDRKTRKQWYQSTNPQIRSYITGNLATNISGKGARSLKRAADEYQYLSEDLARNSYSSKAMSKKYDKFNGIDSYILDKALENENKQLDTYKQQFNAGQLNERKFNRLQRKHERRINNLNENYQTLSEVWHNKHDIPLVRTQSSVSSAPFLLGTIGVPAAIIGLISGGAAAAPYIGKTLANPWVQRGLTGLDVVDTGVQVASGNYLGAAANWIPFGKISEKARKVMHNSSELAKNLYNRYTAPRTSIKHTPYKGDQLQLTKFRLVNGGFDKLGIGPTDAFELPYGVVNARQHLLKSKAVPLLEEVPGTAYYDSQTKIYTSPSYGKDGKLDGKTKAITAHEFTHAVDDVVDEKFKIDAYPKGKQMNTSQFDPEDILDDDIPWDDDPGFPKDVDGPANPWPKDYDPDNYGPEDVYGPDDPYWDEHIDWSEDIDLDKWVNPPGTDVTKIPSRVSDYFRKYEGTELHARLAQLKNWYGIRDPHQPITPEMWNYARRHYVPSMGGFDNNMQQMFRFVTDPKKFLDWINPRVAVQAGAIGTAGLSTLKKDEKK